MIVSSIMAVDTQEYGVFDENASRRFHPPSLRSYGGQVETVILDGADIRDKVNSINPENPACLAIVDEGG